MIREIKILNKYQHVGTYLKSYVVIAKWTVIIAFSGHKNSQFECVTQSTPVSVYNMYSIIDT